MTTITGNQTHTDSREEGAFDALVSPGRTQPAPHATAPRTIEDLMLAEPSQPRASLKTVALVFLAIAIAQLGVLALALTSFDLAAFRIMLAYVVIAPAVLYTIVAAWDHRQLVASGHASAPRWEWAFIFPPIYLGLRWLRVTVPRQDMVAALGWAIAQFAVTAAFVVFAATALVASPGVSAGAVSAPEIGDVTASVVEQQVEQAWADGGDTGTAACAEPASQEPGTAISCTGVFAGGPIQFTAVIGDGGAGDGAFTISRWSNGIPG